MGAYGPRIAVAGPVERVMPANVKSRPGRHLLGISGVETDRAIVVRTAKHAEALGEWRIPVRTQRAWTDGSHGLPAVRRTGLARTLLCVQDREVARVLYLFRWRQPVVW